MASAMVLAWQINYSAHAAKLRLLHSIGRTCLRRHKKELLCAQADSLRRPFGAWHYGAYAKVLCDNEEDLAALGVVRSDVVKTISRNKVSEFQKHAREMIVRRIAA